MAMRIPLTSLREEKGFGLGANETGNFNLTRSVKPKKRKPF
jgi:hypothetical protein